MMQALEEDLPPVIAVSDHKEFCATFSEQM